MIPILSAEKYNMITYNIPDMATSKEKPFNYLNSETVLYSFSIIHVMNVFRNCTIKFVAFSSQKIF